MELHGRLWTWQLLSLLALISAGCVAWWMLVTFVNWLQQRSSNNTAVHSASALGFLAMICVAVLAIVLFVEPHMDRYWMFLLPALTIWCLLLASQHHWRLSRVAMTWAWLCIVGNMTMSVVFTHDMLAWNHARWNYVNAQLAAGVRSDAIDGGRDVNAWLRMDEDPDTHARSGDLSPWWSGRARIALAIGSRPGWHVVDRLPWQAWATARTHRLLVLERDTDTIRDADAGPHVSTDVNTAPHAGTAPHATYDVDSKGQP
jgi:hypothetical protein